MKFGLDVVSFGDYADPRNVVELAQAAEASGWDGLFVWDHLAFTWGVPSGNPFVILSAVAQATERLKFGPTLTPIARHQPLILANILATLDLLSAGRLIFGAGLGGVAEEFQAYGGPVEAKTRAIMLDEGLEILSRLFNGEALTYQGQYYVVRDSTLSPLPLQRPRPPFWIGGDSHPALRRAAQWDGWVTTCMDEVHNITQSPELFAERLAYLRQRRSSAEPFEIALSGTAIPGKEALVKEFAAAGATWWLETVAPLFGSHEEMLARVKAGPPRG